ncbi:uncharacterized protein F4822DRAFT_76983 [Hypoxylon trugodes]|uniref:uncharacterized protein n=1 Tax=Hypoxylon trugodes TaxID=326681 RepID=UPI00219E6131|nr:uncharacterized protein F4822DRAFT_76983 [Hypoxylon trugodes]KAI1383410.1 hypothetical protein F4822DRAFT_76983 [Hypoxylon trugodes]
MASPDNPSDDVTQEDASVRLAETEAFLRRAQLLQSEVQRFADHLEEVYHGYSQHSPAYVHTSFTNEVKAEAESLEKDIREPKPSDPLGVHHPHSSNLPFLEPIWGIAKNSKDVVRIRCALSTGPYKKQVLAPGTRIVRSQGESRPNKLGSFIVDVVTDGGHSWYKVSSMTNKRVLFDLAKEAIYGGDSDDDEDVGAILQHYEDIPLVKLARNLANTAKGHHIQTKNPSTFIVLPRIKEGEYPEVDKVLNVCRQLGVTLLCGDSVPPAPLLSDTLLHTMAPDPKANFTQILNIDTSLLVALASDFSHGVVVKQPWFSQSHNDHVDLEIAQPMLSMVYPLIGNHELVCTKEAAETFFHIVDTLSTDSEKARAYLIVDSITKNSEKSQEQRIEELRPLSIHDVPSSLQLPITIVDMNEDNCQDRLSDLIKEKLGNVVNPGQSVFSYGWAKGLTTMTCNSLVIKQLERDLESLPTLDVPWPSIWAFPTSRPFVGVPKSMREQPQKHVEDYIETCTSGIDKLLRSSK